MGKLNAALLKYMSSEEFRVLTSIEMGMKNHQLVPISLITSIAALKHGGVYKILQRLCRNRLAAYERAGQRHDGYRLTNAGYDYLSLRALSCRLVDQPEEAEEGGEEVDSDESAVVAVQSIGKQIGVGKESDVYVVTDGNGRHRCLKLHRLGRTSFRQLANKRDYLVHRRNYSWLYLSRLAAKREFDFLQLLHRHRFAVPRPLALNRHAVVMELVDGLPLCQIHQLSSIEKTYTELMGMIERLAEHGLIHGDFNEFNLMLLSSVDGGEESVVMIDFPQMVSVSHRNARHYFQRDVNCVVEFFRKRFGYDGDYVPDFGDVVVGDQRLDLIVRASGFNHGSGSDDEYHDDNDDDGCFLMVDLVSREFFRLIFAAYQIGNDDEQIEFIRPLDGEELSESDGSSQDDDDNEEVENEKEEEKEDEEVVKELHDSQPNEVDGNLDHQVDKLSLNEIANGFVCPKVEGTSSISSSIPPEISAWAKNSNKQKELSQRFLVIKKRLKKQRKTVEQRNRSRRTIKAGETAVTVTKRRSNQHEIKWSLDAHSAGYDD